MSIIVHEWKNAQAALLDELSERVRKIADWLNEDLTKLSETNGVVFNNQVSGPPAMTLADDWNNWFSNTSPLVQSLYSISNNMHATANQWHDSYRLECHQVEMAAAEAAAQKAKPDNKA